MTPKEMLPVLKNLGFTDLSLVKTEGTTSTFKFSDLNLAELSRIGRPSVTNNGKVLVFVVPNLGRVGIAPSTNLLRVIAVEDTTTRKSRTDHLADFSYVPQAYITALEKAKVQPSLQTKWMAKMWSYFNDHKFGGRMKAPNFKVGIAKQNTRGLYQGGPAHSPGTISLATYLWNARNAFILEIFVHEMCHQAVWNIDRVWDRTAQGHGPNWQAWMRKVGLDARRFDPTDSSEYSSRADTREADAWAQKNLGKPTPESFWKDKVKVNTAFIGKPCWLRYRERAVPAIVSRRNNTFVFTFKSKDGVVMELPYQTWPAGDVYVEK